MSKNLRIKTYETVIPPVILYGSETWFFNIMKEGV
jgi:hypothetical protein